MTTRRPTHQQGHHPGGANIRADNRGQRRRPHSPDLTIPADYPSYRWLCAPAGYATRRQLAALGLRPGGRQPVARIVWRKGRRWADLYVIHHAKPKRTPTPAQLAALDAAMRARRTCRTCGRDAGYCLPTSWPGCLDCHPDPYARTVPTDAPAAVAA